MTSVDLHTLAEERSLELHRAIARRLAAEPELVARARARIEQWGESGAVSRHYVDAWRALLAGSTEEVARAITDPAQRARDLRQVTPFAGVIDPRTRWRIWREVRARLGR